LNYQKLRNGIGGVYQEYDKTTKKRGNVTVKNVYASSFVYPSIKLEVPIGKNRQWAKWKTCGGV